MNPQAVLTERLEVSASFAAASSLRAWLRGILDRWCLSPECVDAASVELALHELFINVVEYAYRGGPSGTVTFVVTKRPSELVIDVHDRGRSFDPTQVAIPDPEVPQVGGYGLSIIEAVMDEVAYDHTDGANHWRLVKHTGAGSSGS